MKRLVSVLVALMMAVFCFTACAAPAAEAPSAEAPAAEAPSADVADAAAAAMAEAGATDVSDQKYILCTYNSTEYYQREIWAGFEAAAKMLGVQAELVGGTGEDVLQYLTLLDNATAMDPQGIAVMCLDGAAYVDGINAADAKGIPVFTVAPDSPNSERICYMGLDNVSVGRYAAEIVCEAAGGEGEVLILIRTGMQSCQDRLAGFEAYMAENYPNMTTEVIQVSLDLTDQTAKTSAALTANPNFSAVYCPLGWQAVAVSQAIDEIGYKQIPILGMDAELAQLELIKEGKIIGTLRQGVYNQGFWACLGLYLINNGYITEETFPSTISNGFFFIDQSNVDAEIEYYYEFNPDAKQG